MSRTDPTILVVDDDPDIVRATRHILTGAGLTVVTASTAADALAQARSLRPALLLLDVNLPDGSGLDVARELKGDPDLADTFVVMASSGRVTTEDQAAGLDQGLADGYIVRPIAGPELLARMHAFLRLHQAQTDLRAALREKDALVREVHHRVKNNLAIVASLLRLEQNRIDHPAARAVLQDMAQRVRSLALLHDLMHQSHHITEVDLGTYLEQLAQRVFRSLAGDTATVRLRLDLAHVTMAASPAISCGLLVNELLTNAIKHGFPGGRTGEVTVTLRIETDRGAGHEDKIPLRCAQRVQRGHRALHQRRRTLSEDLRGRCDPGRGGHDVGWPDRRSQRPGPARRVVRRRRRRPGSHRGLGGRQQAPRGAVQRAGPPRWALH